MWRDMCSLASGSWGFFPSVWFCAYLSTILKCWISTKGFFVIQYFRSFQWTHFFVHLLSILRQQIYQCIFHCDFGKRCWQTVQYLEVWTVGIRRDPCSPSCCLSTRCLRRWAWMGGVLMRFLILSKWWSKQVLISGWQTIHKQGPHPQFHEHQSI